MGDELELSNVLALSKLDGRYWSKVKDLAPFMSEYALIKYRVLVERFHALAMKLSALCLIWWMNLEIVMHWKFKR